LFDKFDVDKIWMAWTENPGDDEAKAVNAHLKDMVAAVGFATRKIKENTTRKEGSSFFTNMYRGTELLGVRKDFQGALQDVTEFFGTPAKVKKLAATNTTTSGIKVRDNYEISLDTAKGF
jgi:hypothetical protein